MPKRLLRDWTDSARFDGITADCERLFVRLIMRADDFGRFHSDPRMVKAMCFPLVENLRTNDLARWLDDLSARQLILRYENDGKKCLAIPNFGQRLKQSVAKFPPFPGEDESWLPCSRNFPEDPGSSRIFPSEGKGSRREVEVESPLPPEGELGLGVTASPNPGSPLPDRWRNIPRIDRTRVKVNFNTPTMDRIGAWFNRAPGKPWNLAEGIALHTLKPNEEDIATLEEYYLADIPKEDYRRRDLITLLNNWDGEVDRAQLWRAEQ